MLLFSCSVVSDSATPWTAAGTVLIARDVGSSMWYDSASSFEDPDLSFNESHASIQQLVSKTLQTVYLINA